MKNRLSLLAQVIRVVFTYIGWIGMEKQTVTEMQIRDVEDRVAHALQCEFARN